MASALRNSLRLGALAVLLSGCGGSGGGGGNPDGIPPTIVAATFVGAAGVPVAGDELLLFFSEDVTANGEVLDDADLALSPGASVGTVSGSPVAVSARAMRIVLGQGVSLTPGTATVALDQGNDAVTDTAGNLGTGGTPVTITAGDSVPPLITQLTLNAIDPELNGTGPAGGTLQTPQHSFTIDLTLSDSSGIDHDLTQLSINLPFAANGAPQHQNTNLAPLLNRTSATGTGATYAVPTTVALPAADLTLTAFVVDASGMPSQPTSFSFRVRNYTDDVRPFETVTNPSQLWFLDMSRDIESYTVNLSNPVTPVEVIAGPNGTSDVADVLAAIGLLSSTPIPNVSGSLNSNDVVLQLLCDQLDTNLTSLFAGANITITFQSPGAFPAGQTSVPYASLGFSQICVGGSESVAGTSGVLGVAIYDPHNSSQNDNSLTNFQGSQRLGVFVHTVVDNGIGGNPLTLFRRTFDPFTPAHGGIAIGNAVDGEDGLRLLDPSRDGRAVEMDTAIASIGRFVAIVIAHECGHSMGLVMNGPMPAGLYGAHPLFGGVDSHISTNALFPPGSTNVMSAALSFSGAVSPDSAFNSLNGAYLREQVLYGN